METKAERHLFLGSLRVFGTASKDWMDSKLSRIILIVGMVSEAKDECTKI